MPAELLKLLTDRYDYIAKRESCDWAAVNCPMDRLVEFLTEMKEEHNFELLVDVTAIDWHEDSPRFSVVYHLYSLPIHKYLRVVSDCADDEAPKAPSVVSLWPAANWHERETFDMFGIQFTGHPDLRRILMWDEYPYHPLRKEFPLAGHEVELPAADVRERVDAKVISAPMMGGPFTAGQGGRLSQSEPRAKDQSWNEQSEKPQQTSSSDD